GGGDDVAAEELARSWARAPTLFDVALDSATARGRLARFLEGSPSGMDRRVRSLERSAPVEFRALALDSDGKPIPVINSDGVLELLLGEPGPAELLKILKPIAAPFPAGLSTEAGVLAARPVFSDRPRDLVDFSTAAY